RLRLFDLHQGRARVADREEQLRVLVAADSAVAPVHAVQLLRANMRRVVPASGKDLVEIPGQVLVKHFTNSPRPDRPRLPAERKGVIMAANRRTWARARLCCMS